MFEAWLLALFLCIPKRHEEIHTKRMHKHTQKNKSAGIIGPVHINWMNSLVCMSQ